MKLSEKQRIFTRNVAKLIKHAYCNGIELTFGEAYRTREQQLIYMQTNKSQTMNSRHLDRLAVDFNFFVNGNLTYDWETVKILGDYWETLHPKNRWGGDWNKNDIKDGWIDAPHFEMQL
jgi:hypothetical protein